HRGSPDRRPSSRRYRPGRRQCQETSRAAPGLPSGRQRQRVRRGLSALATADGFQRLNDRSNRKFQRQNSHSKMIENHAKKEQQETEETEKGAKVFILYSLCCLLLVFLSMFDHLGVNCPRS